MRRKDHTALLRVAGTLAVAVATACSADFAPFNRLADLRILGIQSDPPGPFSGDMATLTALVYAPPGFPEPQYEWRWCPLPASADDGYRCRVTDQDIAAMFPAQAGQLPPLFIGTGPRVTLTNAIDGALVAGFCAGASGAIGNLVNCDNGFPIQISLRVTTTSADPKQTDIVDAVTTTYWRFDPATPPNTNPKIDRLETLFLGVTEPITDVPSPSSTALPRDVATNLRAVIGPLAAEEYRGVDDERNPADLRERLFVTWFVETGDTDDTRTSFSPTKPTDLVEDARRFTNLQLNSWEPGLKKDYAPDQADIFVVIHDNRGGVSWTGGTVNLVPTP